MKPNSVVAILLYIGVLGLFFSCKKEEKKSPMPQKEVAQPKEEMDPVSAKDAQMMSFFIEDFPTELVQPRNVEIWFPSSYSKDPNKRYPVLYMQDGQNVFNPETSTNKVPWAADKVAQNLMDEGKIQETIIVAIWSTDNRFGDYMPKKVFDKLPLKVQQETKEKVKTDIVSDAYIQFIFEDLKPYVDGQFRTIVDRDHTYIAGSSMGGLISLYAICEYSSIFGRAACVSTHWPVSLEGNESEAVKNAWKNYLVNHLPNPKTHKIWFDYGTETLDAMYEPYQKVVDEAMKERGYTEGVNWVTKKYPGSAHNEESWQARLSDIFTFLLK